MRRIVKYNVIEGDPNLVKSNEIWLKRNYETGTIDLQKRNSSGILVSIVANTSVLANPSKGLTPVANGDPFDQAFETLMAQATTAGAEVEITEDISEAVEVIIDYLPKQADSTIKGTNKINVSGYFNDDTVIVSTGATMLKVEFVDDTNVKLTKVEL